MLCKTVSLQVLCKTMSLYSVRLFLRLQLGKFLRGSGLQLSVTTTTPPPPRKNNRVFFD